MTEEDVRQDLALAYQFLAALGMDDLTYTHLSARVPGSDVFYIYPFGLLFGEVTKDNLLTVTLDGKVIAGSESQYNKTGYVIHSGIYRTRPDLNAIFHLHTISGVAVAAMECGLLPISQFSFHFYDRMAYHAYDSLALDIVKQGSKLADDLGSYKAITEPWNINGRSNYSRSIFLCLLFRKSLPSSMYGSSKRSATCLSEKGSL